MEPKGFGEREKMKKRIKEEQDMISKNFFTKITRNGDTPTYT